MVARSLSFLAYTLWAFSRFLLWKRDHKLIRKSISNRDILPFALVGFAFAAGWTPCVGPVLGGILGLAASAPGAAFVSAFSYAIGLGIPFLLVGLFVAQSSDVINRYADSSNM